MSTLESTSECDIEEVASEWNDLTVQQLKEELLGRGLETTGRKADLVARLEASDRELLEQQTLESVGNGEGVGENEDSEFVVWNDEHDADKLLGDGDVVIGESLTEGMRPSIGSRESMSGEGAVGGAGELMESKLADDVEMNEEEEREEVKGSVACNEIESGAIGAAVENIEYGVDMSKDRDQVVVTWRHLKIVVPFRDEVQKEMRYFAKKQNVIMYPVELTDIYSDMFRRHIEAATNVSMELDETIPAMPSKGYLRLKFGSIAEADLAMEELKELRKLEGRELKMRHFADDDSEGEVLSHVKKDDADKRDPLVHRLLFVGNLPTGVTESSLKAEFSGVLRVYLPHKEESTERNGYAYLEYASEAATIEAQTKHQGIEIDGKPVFVIKSLTQKKETFGLLRDSLRKYWLEQLRTLEATKAKPHNRSVRELAELDSKLSRLKRRIDKDNVVRESLSLPIPESERFGTTDADSDKERDKNEVVGGKEKEGSVGRKERKSEDKRRSPTARRRHSPSLYNSGRSRGGYRGYSGNMGGGGTYRGMIGSSSYLSSRGGATSAVRNADVLVNQLQELVGVLANKVPDARSDYGRGDNYGRSSTSSYSDVRQSGFRGGSFNSYRGSFRGGATGGRFASSKRPLHDDEYPPERKRRTDDGFDYGRYSGGDHRGDRSGMSNYGSGYGGGSASRRGGGYY